MSARAMPQTPPTPRTPMYAIGIVVLAGLFCYVAFMAIDTVGLESKVVQARVVSTGYRAAGQTYVTQIIDNRPYVMPRTVPEMFLANLDLEGKIVTAAVDRSTHDRLRENDTVDVTFRRTRITGRTEVTAVQ
jgi:hypothetical protein